MMTETEGKFVRFRLFSWWQLYCRSILFIVDRSSASVWGRVLILPAALDNDGDEVNKGNERSDGDEVNEENEGIDGDEVNERDEGRGRS